MSVLTRARAARRFCTSVEPAAAERSLARYHARWQPRVRRLASRHQRLAELAVTFPGLLFALATRENDDSRAIGLAIAGAPLRTVADTAGVPLWLRRLPPEAFNAPLDRLPDSEMFRRRIANHLPRRVKSAARWLDTVQASADFGDQGFAVWMAGEIVRGNKLKQPESLRLIALYAWFSRRPHTAAHRFARKPWLDTMNLKTAVAEAEAWHKAVLLNLALANKEFDPWFTPGVVMGLKFVPLVTAEAITEEALAMNNCVRGYGWSVARGHERLWSIRQGSERVATLSVGFQTAPACVPIPQVFELQGPGNAEAPAEVWRTALRWIGNHDFTGFNQKPLVLEKTAPDRAAWIALWRPYWLAKRRIPGWLPLAPDPAAFRRLRWP